MSFTRNASGELVELVEQTVDEEAKDQELQAELEQAQSDYNAVQAHHSELDQASLAAEQVASDAADALDAHKVEVEAAEERVQKSTAEHASFQEARQLPANGAGAEAEDAGDSDTDGAEGEADTEGESVSEAVEVPVNVVDPEPAAG